MKAQTKKEWKCPPHFWIVDEYDIGICKYCGLKRDFGAMQHKLRRPSVPEWVTKKASLGGRRAHGNNNGYFASGSEI